MRIGRPLLKLPIRFCGETLASQVSALPASAWGEHPQKLDGNIAVPLVSPGGGINDQVAGPMAPTPWLSQCPYILEIMRAFDCTWGRSRLMGLRPAAVVPEHVDVHYYWRTHLRVHIPVITNPQVAFTCAGGTVHMEPGECWILDSFHPHQVTNGGRETRIHLVLDTVGSGKLWDLIEEALAETHEHRFVAPGETAQRPIDYEQVNAPLIMSPWEMQCHLAYIGEWTDEQPGRDEVLAIVDRFAMSWSGAWARYGISDEGLSVYLHHLNEARTALAAYSGPAVQMRNGRLLVDTVVRFILANAIAPSIMQRLQMRSPSASAFRITA